MSFALRRRESEPLIDLSIARRCHLVGIGGPGMSPIATLLAARGHIVTGSDTRSSTASEQLLSRGVAVATQHDAVLVEGVDVVVYSTAIPANNIELEAARSLGIAVRHRSGMLASLCATSRSIGVAGTHGKTTTTALLALMLQAGGLDPSVIIGAEVEGYETGARLGNSDVFLLEADESDGTLDVLPLTSIVVTNVDVDHLDYFGSFSEVQQCFAEAAARATGMVVLNADDEGSVIIRESMSGKQNVVTFGRHENADIRIDAITGNENGITVSLSAHGGAYSCNLPLRGNHNAMNLAAAIAMANSYGVPIDVACQSVESFQGVSRRFTERGTFHDAQLIDDYAHLPAEIAAAIQAAHMHPALTGRLVAVFQPNRFHRIAAMANTYSDCFSGADRVVITDVYASGTEPIAGVTGKMVADAITAAHPEADVVWAQSRQDIVRSLKDFLLPGDLCLSMGCGDIETLPDDLMTSVS